MAAEGLGRELVVVTNAHDLADLIVAAVRSDIPFATVNGLSFPQGPVQHGQPVRLGAAWAPLKSWHAVRHFQDLRNPLR